MSSRLVFLTFLGFALVQMSDAHKLRADSTTHQWASVVNMSSKVSAAMSDLTNLQTLIAQQTLAPVVNCYTGSDSNYGSFGNAAGQFGTSDFSIDFWVQTTETSILRFDLIGNRYADGLGNYISARMYGQTLAGIATPGAITVEICQDTTYNYYAFVASQGGLNDGNWHHVGIVRQGTSLSLYIDGALSKQNTANNVANINNSYDFRMGRSVNTHREPGRFTGAACYSGPRVERRAWSAQEIAAKYTSTHP